MYSGYEIAFDGLGSWSFGNDFARNFITYSVNISLSSHGENHKNIFEYFLVLGEGPTDDISDSIGTAE